MKNSFNTTLQICDEAGEEQEINICITYDAAYEAEYITGLPENCYPSTSEMDFTDLEILDDLPPGITPEMVTAAAEQAKERLEQEAWEDYMSEDE